MDVRRNKILVTTLTTLTVLIALTLALVGGGAFGKRHGLRAGDPSPMIWRGADLSTPVVAWVFRAEDCLACFTPARELRGLQAEYGDRLRIWAVAVDDPRNLAGPFLRGERIRAQHRSIDSGMYRQLFGRAELPALYVSLRDTIRGVWTPQQPDSATADDELPAMMRMITDFSGRPNSRE